MGDGIICHHFLILYDLTPLARVRPAVSLEKKPIPGLTSCFTRAAVLFDQVLQGVDQACEGFRQFLYSAMDLGEATCFSTVITPGADFGVLGSASGVSSFTCLLSQTRLREASPLKQLHTIRGTSNPTALHTSSRVS